MPKFLRFFLILIALIVAALVLIPILFKYQIFELVKEESSNAIKGEVLIEDMSLSLFSDFPNLTLSLKDIQITGEGDFEGVDLMKVADFEVEIDLFSAMDGTNLEVESIRLNQADLYILVMPNGLANYDIAKESEEPMTEETENSESYSLSLKSFQIIESSIIYDDRSSDVFARVENLNHTLSGDFSQGLVDIRTQTSMDALTVSMGTTDYLRQVEVDADMDMAYELSSGTLSLKENEVALNGLILQADGTVVMSDDMQLDLSFGAPHTEFKEVLSLIPELYKNDFDDIEANGSFTLDGSVEGTLDETDNLPALALNLKVSNASFLYSDVSEGAENLNIELHIAKPVGVSNLTTINIPAFSGDLAGQPIDMKLSITHPVSDPEIDLVANTDLDLDKVAQLMPQEDLSYSGRVVTDLELAGKLSDFENQNASAITAKGKVQLSDFVAKTTSFGLPFELDTMNLSWSPRSVRVSTLQGNLGKSTFQGRGSLDNLLSYFLSDTTLVGRFDLQSTLFDLDELAAAAPASEEGVEEEPSEAMTAVRIAQNLDMDLNARIDKVIYDGMEIDDVRGKVMLVNGVAYLEQLNMNALGGRIGLNGSYDSKHEQPEVVMNVNLQRLSFAEAFEYIDLLSSFAPITQSAKGKLNTEFSLNALLEGDMTPILTSVSSKGLLNTYGVKVEPEVLNNVATQLNSDRYSALQLGNTEVAYTIDQGRLTVEPFTAKLGGRSAVVTGSAGLDQSMDFNLATKLPISGISVPSEIEQLGLTGDVDVNIGIGGSFTNPSVKLNYGDITSDIQNRVQGAIQNEINNQVVRFNNQANQERERLLAEARAQAQRVKDEAKVQADRVRTEGDRLAQATRDEAKRQGEKLIEEAGSNVIAKAAAERGARALEAEADDKAKEIEAEAERRAVQIETEAANRAAQIIAAAEENSQINN